MNMHPVYHQLWATYLLLFYSQVQRQLATKFWAGVLKSWDGRILNFLTMSGGLWKPQSQLTWKKLRPQHYGAVYRQNWIATRQQWQSYGPILTTWPQLSHYPSKTSRDLRNNGVKGLFSSQTSFGPQKHTGQSSSCFYINMGPKLFIHNARSSQRRRPMMINETP